jgi:translation initiation factor IF-2
MQSIKLHEATKEFKISNKLAMFFLKKINLPVKSHSSVISMEQLERLREFSQNTGKFAEVIGAFERIEAEKKKKKKVQEVEEKKPEPKLKAKEEEKAEVEKKREAAPPIQKPAEAEIRAKEKPVERERDRIQKEARPKESHQERPGEKPAVDKATWEDEKREKKKTVKRFKDDDRRPFRGKKEEPVKEVKKIEKKKEKFKHKHIKKREFKKPTKKEEVKAPPVIPAVKPKKKEEPLVLPEVVQVSDFITVKELSEKFNIKLKRVVETLNELKKEYMTNQIMDLEDVKEVCHKLNVKLEVVSYEDYIFLNSIKQNKIEQIPRAPVVTVMGHVDHGKTTLLDSLRKTRVAEKEAGGITQSIGAYKLKLKGNDIIFIDTPGHEAFTTLRARGAKVTDLVVLVVAANDGVQPQTIEAINHARAAEVPIIVAINKIDLDGADPNKVKQELSQRNLLVEDWGGDVVSVEISAKLNQNLDALLEMIILVAEMQELKTYPDIPGRGTIIESRLDPQLGAVATVLILNGIVRRGDFFICGNAVGKIKSIFDDRGDTLTEVRAPVPVEIMGFEEVPQAGDIFQIVHDIEKARKVIGMRKIKGKEARGEEVMQEKKLSLQNLFKKIEADQTKTFPLIIKTDNFGSGEVLEKILLKQDSENLKIDIVHKGIGNIAESDILLASTAGAIILGFNVKAAQKILALAKRERIEIKLYNVIYHLIEDIEKAIKGEMEPEYVENQIGVVEVLQKFKISKVGIVAGCLVKDGKVTNKSKVKVLRGKDFIFEGDLESLKRVKDEVSEVKAGTECGIKIKNFNAIEVGDTLEIYERTLVQ